jgi:predicted RNA-binding Zn ribbon-like protein
VSRRGDPERIYQAQRAGIFMRLVSEARLDRFDAEHWIARWEREAEATGRERGSTGFWDDAWRWIEDERSRPKTSMSAEHD